ncbi:DUF4870 domain-containing protein [Niabella soli]|uniref:Import component protein n=1 Tax=Niabella soli DSM 19437 TaxID=929713 RepID=W0F073_9BACT|nr:hypothetical protein [Niabella soli]AHF14731.1 hypothetical protein NIASO_05050 [Niabella soli DSM 19437]
METGPQGINDNESKTIAVISYLTPIGWIIAYVMHHNNKSVFASYHLRQTLLLMLISLGVYVVQTMLLFIPYIGWLITLFSMVLNIGLLVLWVIGLIAAINGEEKPIPLIGEKAQLLFAKIV